MPASTRLSFRCSDFCRPRHPTRFDVKVQISQIHSQNEGFASIQLFIRLSIKDGDLVWMESNDGERVAIQLKIDLEQKDEEVVRVSVTIAALLGFAWRVPSDGASIWIQPCFDQPEEAITVTLRALGRPVPKRIGPRLSEKVEFPPIGDETRLLTVGLLLSIPDKAELFVYEVHSINDIDKSSTEKMVFVSSLKTEWNLETYPLKKATRRLPPVLNSLPHPTVPTLHSTLQVPASSPSAHKIFHVIGSRENHVNLCVQAAADRLGMRYLEVNGLAAFAHAAGLRVTTGGLINRLEGLKAALQQAHQSAPCVLHLLGLNEEVSATDEPLRQIEEQRIWTTLVSTLTTVETTGLSFWRFTPSVLVVLSTATPLKTGPWMQNIVFPSVSVTIPDEIYARHIWSDDLSFDTKLLVRRTADEIVKLRRIYLLNANALHSAEAHRYDLAEICFKMDSQKKTFTTNIPNVRWEDVGGLAHVRSEIMDAIELPLRHPDLFQGSSRSGILLYGPPGTGKTLVAKAVATECGLPFLSVKGPELLGSFVGESEANVRQIFETARLAAKMNNPEAAILFFDELDSLAPRRGGVADGGGVMERVVSTLLSELDGRQSEEKVFMIGATNRPDLLDPSLLRPGRLDRLVYLGLATSTEDRAKILAALIRKFRLEDDPIVISRKVVCKFPLNLSGADFSAIASGAIMKSLQRLCMDAENELQQRQQVSTVDINLDDILDEWSESRLVPLVSINDFVDAAKDVIPSVNMEDLQRYESLRREFSSPAISKVSSLKSNS